MVEKIEGAFGGLQGKTVALLGLAFKPNTDDMRESPAIPIARGLLARGATVRAFDPAAMEAAKLDLPELVYCDSAYEAARGADGIVIATEWNQFRSLEWGELRRTLRAPLVVDLRNLYDPQRMAAEGFRYVSVGRREGRPEQVIA
jgi:UDPglucose 6-dehydrogenase